MTKAPFTAEQAEKLNEYQKSGMFHPYTCGNDSRHAVLVATEKGWHCPDCDYTQDWAHDGHMRGVLPKFVFQDSK